MKLRKILALAVTAAMLFTAIPGVSAAGILQEQEHENISMEELRSTLSFSMEDFDADVAALEALLPDAANSAAVTDALSAIRQDYLDLNTLLTIADLDTYIDVTDEQAAEDYSTYTDDYYTVDEEMYTIAADVLASPNAGCLDETDDVWSYYIDYGDASDYTDEELSLFDEEDSLESEYYDAADQVYTADIGGTAYTDDDAYNAYLNDEISYSDYYAVYDEISQQENAAMAGIYVSLVKNRRQQAKLYGYDDPAAMYDDYTYFRDYDQADREAFYAAVKQYIVPLIDPILDRMDEIAYTTEITDAGFSSDELLSDVRVGLGAVSEELLPAFDYMTEYGYYDIDGGENQAEVSFTTMLYTPNAPFLLLTPYNYGYDFSTLVHEFGHYNAYYCSPDPFSSNIDLAEIHSQGLELLMLPQYETVFGAEAEYQELETIYQMLYSLVDGCMFDEFERYAYNEDDLTVDKLNAEYMNLLKAYGDRDADDPDEYAYSWVEISHLYSDPLYYLSYATSAAAAFDIWSASTEDYDGAVETYLNLVSMGEAGGFYETLDACGLNDPLAAESISVLAERLAEHYGLSGYAPAESAETAAVEAQDGASTAEAPAVVDNTGIQTAAPVSEEPSAEASSAAEETDESENENNSGFPVTTAVVAMGAGVIVGVLARRRKAR